MTLLDSESRALLDDILPRYSPAPGMPSEEVRRRALELGRLLQGEPVSMAAITDISIPPTGLVPIRLYRPAAADGGWMLWIHGGGFVSGGLDTHDLLCRRLADGCGQTVISLDYRLAPENPYPAALDDCLAVLDWLMARGTQSGLDPERGAIGGSSAGGNLAAAVTIARRGREGPGLRCQVLVYPCVDATMSMSRYATHGEGYQLTSAMMAHYLDAYCGAAPVRDQPLLSPFFAPDLTGLPPAHVAIAELDPLSEEAGAYATRLADSGVPVERCNYLGVMHGFFAQAGVLTKAREAQRAACDFLRVHLRRADARNPGSRPENKGCAGADRDSARNKGAK
ncbi:alpha/beta hydrolase [Chelatococcus asaccharovorans]|uniref:Acetyl esterase n=1 Tax=Chelatococcus asaccharovorans TaxID=28210 RepID=A0A2V3TQT7_9HYPH|nr:alpha/beta hydrolase [Chelatococcus asaccharovorans]MBS7708133.1 alpha/beta hydrolase [Chelatococcus asaccharovorans]PXW50697.1 acetyl esterase [Chelatococcus asaccharovorans]